MLNIPCPWCGARNETEFVCGGPLKVQRPDDAGDYDDATWVDYLTVRPNPAGWLAENWWHARGCGRWFQLWRHTVTHEIRLTPERPDE